MSQVYVKNYKLNVQNSTIDQKIKILKNKIK